MSFFRAEKNNNVDNPEKSQREINPENKLNESEPKDKGEKLDKPQNGHEKFVDQYKVPDYQHPKLDQNKKPDGSDSDDGHGEQGDGKIRDLPKERGLPEKSSNKVKEDDDMEH